MTILGYVIFIDSLMIYACQQLELNLFTVERSVNIAHKIAKHFNIDLAAIKQYMIY